MKNKKLKQKLLNHMLKGGKKHTSEKNLIKSFKSIQKSKKKPHDTVMKSAILNTTPMFRVIKLKVKNKRKKSVREIPAFLSTYHYRTSWTLKYLIKVSKTNKNFSENFVNEILLSSKNESKSIILKNELQNKALQKKKYFKHYRW